EVDFVAVSHAPDPDTRAWAAKFGGWPEAVRLVSDPSRALYGQWGAPRTSPWHWLRLGSTLSVLRLALRGIRSRRAVGTRAQSAATFALDAQGRMKMKHLPAHAGDLPDLDRAARAASE